MQTNFHNAIKRVNLFNLYTHIVTTFEKEQASASVHFIAFLISTCNERCLYTLFTEFSRHPELDENVAVIVFGRETKFLHYYSNDYPAIKQNIGKIFSFSVC